MNRRSYDRGAACDVDAVDIEAVARATSRQPDEERVRLLAETFAALSDPTRLRILLALSHGKLCVCDLAAVTGASASAVSHQLRVLRDRRLVTFDREGKRAVYRLADAHVEMLLAQGAEHAEERL